MLNFYTVDWADVVRQSMVTLKRCLEQAEQAKQDELTKQQEEENQRAE